MLFPTPALNQPLILKAFYQTKYVKFFSTAVVLISLSILDNALINAYTLWDQPVQLSLLEILSFMIYIKPKPDWAHLTLAILLLLFLLGSMAVADWTIGN